VEEVARSGFFALGESHQSVPVVINVINQPLVRPSASQPCRRHHAVWHHRLHTLRHLRKFECPMIMPRFVPDQPGHHSVSVVIVDSDVRGSGGIRRVDYSEVSSATVVSRKSESQLSTLSPRSWQSSCNPMALSALTRVSSEHQSRRSSRSCVHPRACGEHFDCAGAPPLVFRPSPRLRGTLFLEKFVNQVFSRLARATNPFLL
jgi:hypothetical protein